jgi:antitoxin HigA-1
MNKKRRLPATHPGEILREELDERGISLNRMARDVRIPLSRVSLIVNGRRAITGDTALRLERYLGASAQFWMNLQSAYDLEIAKEKLGGQIRHVVPADRSAA